MKTVAEIVLRWFVGPKLGVAAVLLGALAAATSHGAEALTAIETDTLSREVRWEEDLDFLGEELPAKHLDFYMLISKEEFDGELHRLESELKQLSDIEIVFRLKRLLARLGVAHTRIGWPPKEPAFRGYPIYFHWFSDGLAIVAAAPKHRELVGSRVVGLGSLTPKQAVAALAPYISHENDAWLRRQSAVLLKNVELLQHLEIAQTDGVVRLSLIRPDGEPLVLDIAPVDSGEPIQWVWAWDELESPPVVRRHQRSSYWYEFLPEAQAMYIQYNRCTDVPGYPFAKFNANMFAEADSNAVERVIIDLRYNGGGSSSVVKPLVKGLKSHPLLNGEDRVYVLIGPNTFSSGVFAAFELRNEVRATLIGEPTGGKPNSYGNTPSFRLPNSQLEVYYCNRNFRLIKDQDPLSLAPDIPASMSLAEFLSGRDPALEAALDRGP